MLKNHCKLCLTVIFLAVTVLLRAEENTNEKNNGTELLKSNKPFSMVVGDNVIVVEKYKLVQNDDSTIQADEKNTKVVEVEGEMKNFWQRLGKNAHGLYLQHQTEFNNFSIGILITFLLAVFANVLTKRIILTCFNEMDSKDKTSLPQLFIEKLRAPVGAFLVVLGIKLSLAQLTFLPKFSAFTGQIAAAFAVLFFGWGLFRITDIIYKHIKNKNRHENKNMQQMLADLLKIVLKSLISLLVILFICQNIFDLNINTLLASAGVVGLAVAFAAQSTIANFFGSMMIILDRPFTIGDLVTISGTTGVVEAVGFRSTKIRALSGNVFFIPNNDLGNAVIENISRRPNIKYTFSLGLVYNTTPEQMRRAIEILHEIMDNRPIFDMENLPPRFCFESFGDWSLNISVIVWFQTQDYFKMQSEKESINFAILERFNAENLEFAFPSNTTYLAGDSSRPLNLGK